MSMKDEIPSRLIIAIGGNATHPEGIRGTPTEQADVAAALGQALLPLMELNTELIITHGNGPVVGKILMRQSIARQRVEPMSLDICVAHSQGGIAYLLMQALENALRAVDDPRHVVCLLTQVEVDPDDPAFKNPSKPIGYFYSEEEAKALTAELGWEMRGGFRTRMASCRAITATQAHCRHFAHSGRGEKRRRGDRRRRRWRAGGAHRKTPAAWR